jgi:hypothetical protein
MTFSTRNDQIPESEGLPRDPFRTAGNIFILLGVSVWVVYAFLRWGLGWSLPLKTFVMVHLSGVVPGSILRHWPFLNGRFR